MLVLHAHPLSSYCQKAIVALYEVGADFELAFLNLGDPAERERFNALWPLGKMPVLEDKARGQVVGESTIIIEYLDTFDPGANRLIPRDPDLAWRARLLDRVFDLHVQSPMQAFVDHARGAPGAGDAALPGICRAKLMTTYDYLEREIGQGPWAMGEAFTLADCAAAPALFYADRVLPFAGAHPNLAAYLQRLKGRPSYARALKEAEPYMNLLPV